MLNIVSGTDLFFVDVSARCPIQTRVFSHAREQTKPPKLGLLVGTQLQRRPPEAQS